MPLVDAVIFDLDNVLYDEKEYFCAAFSKIADFLSNHCNLSQEQIYKKLIDDFRKKTSMHPRLFDDLIADCGLDQNLITDILTIFSSVTPKLRLYPGAEELLQVLKKQNFKLGLITNGSVTTQQNKIRLLRLERYFDVIVYARELGISSEKPSPEAYRVALAKLGAKPERVICIGDNPYTDFLGAKKLGIKTVRLLEGEFKNVRLSEEYEADVTARSLDEVYSVIRKTSF